MLCSKVTTEAIENALLESKSKTIVLFDGFPRTLPQCDAFKKRFRDCDYVIYMNCPENVRIERLYERSQVSKGGNVQ